MGLKEGIELIEKRRHLVRNSVLHTSLFFRLLIFGLLIVFLSFSILIESSTAQPTATGVATTPASPEQISTSANIFGYGTYTYTSPENASIFKWWRNNNPIIEDVNVTFLAHFDKASLNGIHNEYFQSPNSLLSHISPALFAPGKIDSGIFIGNSTNRLFNPSFENPYTTDFNSGIYGWLYQSGGNAGGGFASNAFLGKKSIIITDPDTTSSWIDLYQCIPALPSTAYTASAYVYASNTGAFALGMFDNTGNPASFKVNDAGCAVFPASANQWQRINVTCTTSSTSYNICIGLMAQTATSGTSYVDAVQLEKIGLHPYGDQKISEFDTQNAALGQNIVPNPSFENSVSGWRSLSRTTCLSTGSFTPSTAQSMRGSYSGLLVHNQGGCAGQDTEYDAQMNPAIAVSPNTNYLASAEVYVLSTSCPTFNIVAETYATPVVFPDPGWTAIRQIYTSPETDALDYAHQQFLTNYYGDAGVPRFVRLMIPFTTQPGENYVSIWLMSSGNGCGGTYYIDNVQVRPYIKPMQILDYALGADKKSGDAILCRFDGTTVCTDGENPASTSGSFTTGRYGQGYSITTGLTTYSTNYVSDANTIFFCGYDSSLCGGSAQNGAYSSDGTYGRIAGSVYLTSNIARVYNTVNLANARTIEFWVTAEAINSADSTGWIMTNVGRDSALTGDFAIALFSTGNLWFGIYDPSYGGWQNVVSPGGLIPIGVPGNSWHHVALVFGEGGMQIYIDGALRASNSYTGTLRNSGWYVGGWPGVIFAESLQGFVDQLKISNKRLSEQQIYEDYLTNFPASGIFEFWVKPNWNGNDGLAHVFLDERGDPNPNLNPYINAFRIYKWTDNNLYFVIWDSVGAQRIVNAPITSWQAGEWHHVAAIFNTTTISGTPSTVMKLYFDGKIADDIINGPTSAYGIARFANTFALGSATDGANPANAVIDDFLATWYVKSPDEISNDNRSKISGRNGTFEFWVKPAWDGSDNAFHPFFINGAPGAVNTFVIAKQADNALACYATDNIVNNRYVQLDVSGWKAGEWHHIACRYSYDDPVYYDVINDVLVGKYLDMWVDGKQVTTGNLLATKLFSPTFYSFFRVGFHESAPATYYAEATIDELRISNMLRSPAEIRESYYRRTYGKLPQAFLAHFESNLLTVDNENPASASGTTFAIGKTGLGQSVLVDSTDSLIYSTAGNLNIEEGTIQFWIKPNWNWNDGADHYLFDSLVNPAYPLANRIAIYKSAGGSLIFTICDIAVCRSAQRAGIGWLSGEWHHISATFGNGMKLYIDGILADSNTYFIHPAEKASSFSVGSSYSSSSQANALIDEFRISGKFLSAVEVYEDYVKQKNSRAFYNNEYMMSLSSSWSSVNDLINFEYIPAGGGVQGAGANSTQSVINSLVQTSDDSTVISSQTDNSVIQQNSYVRDSIIVNSGIINSTIIESNITESTVDNSSVYNSTIVFSIVNRSFVNNSLILSSYILDSLINLSFINLSFVNGSLITNSTIFNSTILNSTVLDSTINNSHNITNSTIYSSFISDSKIWNSNITNSTVLFSFINGSMINYSYILNSSIFNSSVNNSIVINSSLSNAAVLDSYIVNSTIINSTIFNSTLINTTVLWSAVNDSYLKDSTITNSTIIALSGTGDNVTISKVANSSLNFTYIFNSTVIAVSGSNNIINNSYKFNVTMFNSTNILAVVIDSQEFNATVNRNCIVRNSLLRNTDIRNDTPLSTISCYVENSTLIDVNASNAQIIGSRLDPTLVIDSTVTNSNLTNATIQHSTISGTNPGCEGFDIFDATIIGDDIIRGRVAHNGILYLGPYKMSSVCAGIPQFGGAGVLGLGELIINKTAPVKNGDSIIVYYKGTKRNLTVRLNASELTQITTQFVMNDNGTYPDVLSDDGIYTTVLAVAGTIEPNATITAFINDTQTGIRFNLSALISVDNTPPSMGTFKITYPLGQSKAKEGQTVTINVYVNSNDTDKVILDCSSIGAGFKQMSSFNHNYSAQCTITGTLTEGNVPVTVNVTDFAGNIVSASTNVAVDSVAPYGPITLYINQTPKDSDGIIQLNWNPSTSADTALYRIYRSRTSGVQLIPGNLVKTSATNFTVDYPGADGTYYYVVTPVDDVGNEGLPSNEVSTTVVTGAPTVSAINVQYPQVQYPQGQTKAKNGDEVTITSAVTDSVGVSAVMINLTNIGAGDNAIMRDDGTLGDVIAGDGVYTVKAVVSGTAGEANLTIVLTANNTVNNKRFAVGYVSVDNVVPYFKDFLVNYPFSQNQVKNGQTFSVFTDIAKNDTLMKVISDCGYLTIVSSVEFNIFDTGITYLADGTCIVLSSAVGEYNTSVSVKAYDQANNLALLYFNVSIDNLPPDAPVLNSLFPSTNGQVPLSWNSVADAVRYNIYRSTTANFNVASGFLVGNSSTALFTDNLGVDSTYYYRVTAVDNVGNEGSQSNVQSSVVDTNAPSIENVQIKYPGAQTAAKNYDDVLVSAVIKDINGISLAYVNAENFSGIALNQMNDNGINGDAVAGDSVYTAKISAFGTTGPKSFTIVANDTLNNTRIMTATAQIDNLGPAINSISILYPNPGSEAKSGNTISIYANISGAVNAVVDCSSIGAGTKQMATLDGLNYSAQCTLIYPGTANQNIVVNATDENGNTAQLSWQVGIDNTPPPAVENITLYDIAPAAGTMMLRWTATNDASYFKVYRSTTPDFGVASAFYIKNTTSLDALDTAGAEGTYYYRVAAVDNVGNEGPASNAVYTSIIFLKPIGKAFVYPAIIRNTANITMTFFGPRNKSIVYVNTTAFDSDGYIVYLNETDEDAVYNSTYIISTGNTMPDGNYSVVFSINDTGSFFRIAVPVYLDNTPPTGSAVINNIGALSFEFVNPEFTAMRLVSLSLTYNDSYALKDCRYSNEDYNFTGWESCTSTRAWLLNNSDGLRTVIYQIRDVAGNILMTNDTIYLNKTGAGLDNSPPSAPIVIDDGDYTNNNKSLRIRWFNSTDHESELLHIPLVYEYRVNCSIAGLIVNWTSVGTVTEISINITDKVANGETCFVEVKSINSAGLFNESESDGIIIDTEPPALVSLESTTHPDTNTWYSDNNPIISWEFNDTISDVRQYSYVLDNIFNTTPDNIPETNDTTAQYFFLGDGTFIFHITAQDYAGNWGPEKRIALKIDSTPPTIPQMLNPSQFTNITLVQFNWTTSSDLSGVDDYFLEVNRTATGEIIFNDTVGNVTTKLIATPTDGTYTARVRARNGAGVWSDFSDSVPTVVDTVPPTISVVKPTAVGVSMTNKPSIVVTTDELASCYYQNSSFSQFKFASDIILGSQLYHETQVSAGNGQSVFTIRCRDLVGNEASVVLTFNVNSAAYPDSALLTLLPSYYAGQVATVDVTIAQTGVKIIDVPKSIITVVVNNTLLKNDDFVWTDKGEGIYGLSFVAPSAGTYPLNVTVGNGRHIEPIVVNELALTVQYLSVGLSPSNTSRIAYASSPDFVFGLASDSSQAYISAGSSVIQISSSTTDGSNYIFVTNTGANIGDRDQYFREKSFLTLLNPSFGYPIERNFFIINAELSYSGIIIVGNRTLGSGRYDLLVRNLGFNRTINKTMIQLDLR